MKVNASFEDYRVVLTLQGEFDLSATDKFNRAVAEACQQSHLQQVVVDLQGVSFMDSSGLGALLGRYQELSEEGIELILAAPSHRAGEILGLAGIDRYISIYPSVEHIPEIENGEGLS